VLQGLPEYNEMKRRVASCAVGAACEGRADAQRPLSPHAQVAADGDALHVRRGADVHALYGPAFVSSAAFWVVGPLSNLPELATAFDCAGDAAMVRPAEKRCVVW
jgi:hypothetical protein